MFGRKEAPRGEVDESLNPFDQAQMACNDTLMSGTGYHAEELRESLGAMSLSITSGLETGEIGILELLRRYELTGVMYKQASIQAKTAGDFPEGSRYVQIAEGYEEIALVLNPHHTKPTE